MIHFKDLIISLLKDTKNMFSVNLTHYLKNYLENIDFDTLHIGERIKKLRALARMQRLLGGNAQRATEEEIAALRRKLRNNNV